MRRWLIPVVLLFATLAATFPLWRVLAPFYFLDDGYLHLFRVFQFDSVLRQGVMYPRWAPDLAYGYGYPLFNYYPPLAYFATEILHLSGFSFPEAIKATFVVVIFIGITGAFTLGRDLFRDNARADWAGALVAIAYVFFPYFLIDLYTRGALAEGFAAAFLPWLIFAIRRTIQRQTLGAIVVTALFSALLVLSHNLTAFLAMPVLGAFVLLELFLLRSSRIKALLALIAAAALGALLSALYWLPLLAEFSLVAISRQNRELGNIIQYSFLTLADIIQASFAYIYHEAPFPLPLVPMLFGAIALIFAVVARRGRVIFFGIVAFIGTMMMLDVTNPIWLGVPALRSIQFPWRLSIFVGLGVAVAIGSLAQTLASSRRLQTHGASLSIIALAGVLIFVALANLVPIRLNNPRGEISLAQLVRFETNSRNIGLGTMDEYLPLTVRFLPRRLNPIAPSTPLPTIRVAEYGAVRRVLNVSAPASTTMYLHAFYFPDWQVRIDGAPVSVAPSTALGLLTFDVPPGEHRVEILLVDTPPRQIAQILFGIGVALLIVLVMILACRRAEELRVIGIILGVVIFAFVSLASVALTGRAPPVQSTNVSVAPELQLAGWRIADAQLDANGWRVTNARATLHVIPYWHIQRAVDEKPVAWRLIDANGRAVTHREQLPRFAAGLPGTWLTNEIVEDHYTLSIAGLVRGEYKLQVAFGQPLKFVDAGVIHLEAGGASLPQPQIARAIDAQVGDEFQLLGYNVEATPRAGEILPVTLFWKIDRDANEDFTAFVHLLDNAGNLIAQQDGLSDDGFNPTTLWLTGTTIADRHDLKLPATLAPGIYRLVAGLYRYETLERLPVKNADKLSADAVAELGEIKVPMNAQDARPSHLSNALLGSTIQLLGYDLQTTREQANLKLYWQARDKIDEDYKVFVHLVDATGQVAAQIDQLPGEGMYPTHIWESGEKIIDIHHLPLTNLGPGTYTIVIGMYAPDTGERLVAIDSQGRELKNRQIEIASLQVTQP